MPVKYIIAFCLLLSVTTAQAAEPVPAEASPPPPAAIAVPMPAAPAGENKPGFFSRLFGTDKPDVGAPIMAPAPTAMVDNSFAKIESDSGTWTVNMMPGGGEMQQCMASLMLKASAPVTGAAAGVAAMPQQTVNVNITRLRGTMMGSQTATDTLQYSVSAMGTPKGGAAALAVDGSAVGRTTMQNMNVSASGEVTDMAALRKTLAAGNKVVFAAGDQKLTVAAATMADLLKKMDACVDKAAKQAK